jgi:hypothetical protein
VSKGRLQEFAVAVETVVDDRDDCWWEGSVCSVMIVVCKQPD